MRLVRTKLLAIVALPAILMVGTTAMASAAQPPYTVVVGSNTSGDHDFSATTVDGVTFRVHDANGEVDMSCTSASATGKVHAGPLMNPVADIETISFIGCNNAPGGPVAVTATTPGGGSSLPWELFGTGNNATSALTDDIAGDVTGVQAHVANVASPTICNFDVSGFAAGDFDESSQTLNVDDEVATGDLTLSNVSGCLGQLASGDLADFVAHFAVTSADGPINLEP